MKKMMILAVAALFAAGCTKGYDSSLDHFGGRSEYYYLDSRYYMLGIADNLVTDALDNLEDALALNGTEVPDGTVWTIQSIIRPLRGMTITKTGSSWKLYYAGDYTIDGETYPLTVTITAVQGTKISSTHYNWRITLVGSRTERGGYSCDFATLGDVQYSYKLTDETSDAVLNKSGWNQIDGTYYAKILKNGQSVDDWRLILDGYPFSARFFPGL